MRVCTHLPQGGSGRGELAIKESERHLRTLTSRLVSASDSPAIFLWRPAVQLNGYGTFTDEGARNYPNASSPFVLIVSSSRSKICSHTSRCIASSVYTLQFFERREPLQVFNKRYRSIRIFSPYWKDKALSPIIFVLLNWIHERVYLCYKIAESRQRTGNSAHLFSCFIL